MAELTQSTFCYSREPACMRRCGGEVDAQLTTPRSPAQGIQYPLLAARGTHSHMPYTHIGTHITHKKF